MSSFIRNIQRKRLRQGTFTTDAEGNSVKVEHEQQPQRTIDLKDGGYVTIRYTRGPLRVSDARLRAQGRLAEIQHPGAMRDQAREFSRMMAGAQKAEASRTRIDALLAAPVAVVTRQMRRLALRTGRPAPLTIAEATEQAVVVAEKVSRARNPRAKKAASVQQAAA